jgi:hypothetical protein
LSVVPDLPSSLPRGIPRELSHSIPGVFVVEIPIAIIVLVLWVLLFRAPLIDFMPGWVRARLRLPGDASAGRHSIWPSLHLVVVSLVSLLVGIATHLGWDALTHSDGWVVLHVAELCVQLGPFTAYR